MRIGNLWKAIVALLAVVSGGKSSSNRDENFTNMVSNIESFGGGLADEEPDNDLAISQDAEAESRFDSASAIKDDISPVTPHFDIPTYINMMRESGLIENVSDVNSDKNENLITLQFSSKEGRLTKVTLIDSNSEKRDLETEVTLEEDRVIFGHDGYKNTASIRTSDLPEGVQFLVLDAKEITNLCASLKDLAQLNDMAQFVEKKCLVLYQKDEAGNVEVISNTFLADGYTKVIVDGKEIEPQHRQLEVGAAGNITSPTPSPTPSPTDNDQHQTQQPEQQILGILATISGTVVILSMLACYYAKMKRDALRQVQPNPNPATMVLRPYPINGMVGDNQIFLDDVRITQVVPVDDSSQQGRL